MKEDTVEKKPLEIRNVLNVLLNSAGLDPVSTTFSISCRILVMQAAGQQTASNCGAVPYHPPVYRTRCRARAHSYVSGVQLYIVQVYRSVVHPLSCPPDVR